jgi:hypothetical protein
MKVLKAFLIDLDDLDREHKHSELSVTLCHSPIFMTHQNMDSLIPLPENVKRYGQKGFTETYLFSY